MFRVDKVITRKEVSVMFEDGNIATGLPKDAERMLLSQGRSGHLLEDLHIDALDILGFPLIENGAEKMAQSLSVHRSVANAALFGGLRLHQGQKFYIVSLELFEESVNLGGMVDVLGMHNTQDVAWD